VSAINPILIDLLGTIRESIPGFACSSQVQ